MFAAVQPTALFDEPGQPGANKTRAASHTKRISARSKSTVTPNRTSPHASSTNSPVAYRGEDQTLFRHYRGFHCETFGDCPGLPDGSRARMSQ
uniref:Uncharacterized protein n=1 Tax=Mycena chlorophos TaxID=658473 RepID=A0ABQ0LEQ8_MYCCL|nr:predicted protein [Mycena chlorophos]